MVEKQINLQPAHSVTESVAKRIDDTRIVATGGYVNNARATVEHHRQCLRANKSVPIEIARNPKAKERVKKEVKEADLQLARPAAEHHRGVTHRWADDRLLKTQRRCVLCTRKEGVRKATQNARLYTIRRANGTRRANVEMAQSAYSRIERWEEWLLFSRHYRRD